MVEIGGSVKLLPILSVGNEENPHKDWVHADTGGEVLKAQHINNACQTCHRWPEAELKARVETIQGRVFGLRNRAMDAVVALIGDLKNARDRGVADAQVSQARKLHIYAQFMLDFVEAENSTGFHAPQEAERLLAESIDYARQGQLVLRGASVPGIKALRSH